MKNNWVLHLKGFDRRLRVRYWSDWLRQSRGAELEFLGSYDCLSPGVTLASQTKRSVKLRCDLDLGSGSAEVWSANRKMNHILIQLLP